MYLRKNLDARQHLKINGTFASGEGVVGFYDILNNVTIGLFVVDRKIYLYNEGVTIECRPDVIVEHSKEGDSRRLVIKWGGDTLDLAYKVDAVQVSYLYSEDEEDVDFGLWISNILNNEERREIFIDNACRLN